MKKFLALLVLLSGLLSGCDTVVGNYDYQQSSTDAVESVETVSIVNSTTDTNTSSYTSKKSATTNSVKAYEEPSSGLSNDNYYTNVVLRVYSKKGFRCFYRS